MAQSIESVSREELRGKRVIVRCDFNVPIAPNGDVLETTRIMRALPTLQLLRDAGARVIIFSHIGREKNETLAPVSTFLSKYIPHTFVSGTPVYAGTAQIVNAMCDGDVLLLENLRQNDGEVGNATAFVHSLAALGDVYVNEAFSNCHRDHASMTGVPHILPHYAGIELMQEVTYIATAHEPPPGSIAVIGGAKFETKEPLIKKLLQSYAHVFLGGALANDVLKARGFPVGASLVQEKPIDVSVVQNERLHVPIDVVVERDGERIVCDAHTVQDTDVIVDVGPKTVEIMGEYVRGAPLVVWNGPLGWYEKGYRDGSQMFARALASTTAQTIIGGGDTIAAVSTETFDPEKNFSFVSIGGGAMLDYLTEGALVGIKVLS